MISRRLRLPASLALSVIGLGVSSCTEPTPQPDAGATCESACSAQHSSPALDCVPATDVDSATACVAVADASSSGLCGIAPVVTTGTGSCCCQPLI
ncbi:MAG: hypothetical protein WCJ30_03215 [Deltaproteobacteria bacterium]